MKKILLSMAAVALCAGAAMADTVTFDFTTNDYGLVRASGSDSGNYLEAGTKVTNGDISFTVGATENAFRLWTDGLRMYKNRDCIMAFAVETGGTIESVTYTTKAKISTYKVDNGTATEVPDKTFTVETGNAESPVVTLTSSSNVAIQTMVVTYTKSATSLLPAGLVFSEKNVNAILGQPFTAPTLTKATDATVAYSSSNPEVATVNATTGAVTLVAAGTTTITASCAATSVYNAGSDSYTLNVMGSYNSIADFYTLSKGGKGVINFPLTITYQNGVNTYVTDGTGYSLIYGSIGTYEVGTIIPAGWVGELDIFNNLPEIKPVGDMTEPTESDEFTPRAVTTVDNTMLNEIVILSGVTFAEETPAAKTNFTGTIGDEEFTFRNNFEIESVAAGTYDVKCAVAIFKTTLQLYPISYNEPVADGISEIETSNGAAVYYNMQGVRVSNPENGMFIRVEGNKATKVIIK